ncbi:tether containing UBX domain for GLUT4 [Phlebotomus papatasi]|uniref:tether containing UBX domain for GLUT4 n=1 Tax=Phlebotomus papatasi TaxID=29031 RepID=UPI0024834C8B|nr:tether containing UBX domain for GLUT4 [Phlebotomus papatasi]
MSYKFLTILTPNGRRHNIKLTLNTTLLEVLEQVCCKFQLDPNQYSLKHHNKAVDLSAMFRFSGLPNNGFLELEETNQVRKETDVQIVIHTESGKRFSGNFSPSVFLQDILVNLCPQEIEFKENPVIIYMRKEIYGSALGTTNLKVLGLTYGKAMLRLRNRDPEEIKMQANVSSLDISTVVSASIANKSFNEEIDLTKNCSFIREQPMQVDDFENSKEDLYKEHIEKDLKAVTSLLTEGDKSCPDTKKQKLEDKNNKQSEQAKELLIDEIKKLEEEIKIIGENDGVVFSLDSFQRVRQESDLPDSFFDLSVDDVRLLLNDLKDQVKSLDNAPMLTAKLRDMENDQRILKLLQYKKTIIRIKFPDRYILQVTLNPVDTIEKVMRVVQNLS